ncbi:MAG: hypothetical protein AB7N80_04660 [Bdellovibrionales bacterium]
MKISTSLIFGFLFAGHVSADGWKVDLSRRVKEASPKELSEAPTESTAVGNVFTSLFDASEPVQELVILNTEKGFVPATVRVRQDGNYKIHVVNVNEREKNVSFVLDAFSEHHATYFGKIKTFEIRPKRNGVFRFVSPETAAQGRLVVYPAADAQPSPEQRLPAAEGP